MFFGSFALEATALEGTDKATIHMVVVLIFSGS